jgi:hypothetical protein
MISKSIFVNDQNVVINFDERLSSLADWLINYMINELPNADQIDEGYTIQMAWSFLVLKRNDKGNLVLCEPDFSRNPFEELVETVNSTLLIQSQQVSFAIDLNLTPLLTSFQDIIIIRKGCFDFSDLYMTRSEPDKDKKDSGWYISSRELEAGDEPLDSTAYTTLYAFELIKYRPVLLECLGLPIGYFVTSNVDQIESVFNSENERIL